MAGPAGGGQLRKSDHKASGRSTPFHRILRATASSDILSLPKAMCMNMVATTVVKIVVICRG
ncbi:hypothetical protein FIB18_00600 [Brucella pecoris]|uniref:Uncharacterized protein n=1 Tax=Brucella pecoris TaxID=867683 RepID=A0A5C5CZ09_9HYPH|nr:hypothetical protein FIB18_00600 [Brucella pecoris]